MGTSIRRSTAVICLLAISLLLLAGIPNTALASNYCGAGETPEFRFGFAHLKSLLGPTMGEPIECEHANPENGDTLQQTTTGLSFYRKATNIPTFTDGWNHWGWTADGLVTWTGDSVDPPGVVVPTATPTPTEVPQPSLPNHSSIVWSVAISPDGSRLASGGLDRSGGIWDIETGRRLYVLDGHTGSVNNVVYSPSGSVLATASEDGGIEPRGQHTIALWNPSNGEKIRTLDGHFADVYSIAISPDGSRLASGGYDQVLRIWDVGSGALIQALEGYSPIITEVAFSPSGGTVAVLHGSRVTLVNAATGDRVGAIEGLSTSWLDELAFHPDGTAMAVGFDGAVVLWDLAAGAVRTSFTGIGGESRHIAFSPDGSLMAVNSRDYLVTLWDVGSGTQLRSMKASDSTAVAFSPSGSNLAIGDRAGGISLWDVATGSRIRDFGSGGSAPVATPAPTAIPAEPTPQPTATPSPSTGASVAAGLDVLAQRQSQVPGMGDVASTLNGMTGRISFGPLPENVFGTYYPSSRSIVVSSALESESAEVIAMVLAHEGQHALDHNLGRLGNDPLVCYDSEVRAFDLQILLWRTLWGSDGKSGALTSVEEDFNFILWLKINSPVTYIVTIIELYGDQCGSL